MKHSNIQYWIQEQSPSGKWFDSIGLYPDCTLEEAKEQLKSWREFDKSARYRLIQRVELEIDL